MEQSSHVISAAGRHHHVSYLVLRSLPLVTMKNDDDVIESKSGHKKKCLFLI